MAVSTYRVVSVQDAAPNTRRGGETRAVLSPGTVGCTSGFMGVATIRPGERIGEHYHPYSEEFLLLLRDRKSVV